MAPFTTVFGRQYQCSISRFVSFGIYISNIFSDLVDISRSWKIDGYFIISIGRKWKSWNKSENVHRMWENPLLSCVFLIFWGVIWLRFILNGHSCLTFCNKFPEWPFGFISFKSCARTIPNNFIPSSWEYYLFIQVKNQTDFYKDFHSLRLVVWEYSARKCAHANNSNDKRLHFKKRFSFLMKS